MPLTRFKLSAIEDGGIATVDLADGAVTTAKIADSAVTSIKTSALFTNTEIAGTEAARMPNGTTAQRANAAAGDIRFNSTISLMEYYDGTIWKAIDSPPVATSVSPSNFDTAGDTITVTGSNFQTGATIKLVAADAAQFSASSVTFTNASTLSFDITAAMVADNGDPYDVVITNPSGLAATMSAALDFAPEPAWTVAAGTLGTIYDTQRTDAQTFTTGATSTESDATVTYAVTTGSLPSGLSIASSTGTITGTTSAVGSDTTVTFTITATATDSNSNITTNTRQYSIVQKSPTVSHYTSTGSGTFSVPTGLTSVDVLVVAGGGTGGSANSITGTDGGAGGGAGGLIYRPSFPVTPGGSISFTVGSGGTGSSYNFANQGPPNKGQDSVFGTLTSKGGGAGQSGPGDASTGGASGAFQGGSGGGAGGGGGNGSVGGQATQPQVGGDSTTYGFGYPGGSNTNTPPYNGNGGGGAGGVGTVGSDGNGNPVPGGAGKSYSISGSSVGYSGGGGGGGGGPGAGAGGSGSSGGGTGRPAVDSAPLNGGAGSANRGGGGAGGAGVDSPRPWATGLGGNGGSGTIIVKY